MEPCFMLDCLINSRQFRILNVIDDNRRVTLMISTDTSLGARRVSRELDRLIEWRGKPKVIRVDFGLEFTSIVFDAWARKHRIKLYLIQPGKPAQNTLIATFNGKY
jgi:putative transposase